jgi:hypothetical protein
MTLPSKKIRHKKYWKDVPKACAARVTANHQQVASRSSFARFHLHTAVYKRALITNNPVTYEALDDPGLLPQNINMKSGIGLG